LHLGRILPLKRGKKGAMLPSWRRARKYAVLVGKGSMLETPSPVSGSTFGNYGLQLLIATKLLAVRFG